MDTHMNCIRCIDCGEIISQYETYTDGIFIVTGYRDTIARANAFDSLRCGHCCLKLLKEGWPNGQRTKETIKN